MRSARGRYDAWPRRWTPRPPPSAWRTNPNCRRPLRVTVCARCPTWRICATSRRSWRLARRARRSPTTPSARRRRARCGSGDTLLRFFAVYYAGVSLVTFVVQAALSRPSLERLGLGGQRRNAVGGAARRRAWGDRRAWPGEHRRGTRRRVGLPRLAVPGELRNLLHADGGRRAARRQVDHRRRVRPAGRCGGRRRRLARAAAPGARAAGHGDPLAGGGNGSRRRSC